MNESHARYGAETNSLHPFSTLLKLLQALLPAIITMDPNNNNILPVANNDADLLLDKDVTNTDWGIWYACALWAFILLSIFGREELLIAIGIATLSFSLGIVYADPDLHYRHELPTVTTACVMIGLSWIAVGFCKLCFHRRKQHKAQAGAPKAASTKFTLDKACFVKPRNAAATTSYWSALVFSGASYICIGTIHLILALVFLAQEDSAENNRPFFFAGWGCVWIVGGVCTQLYEERTSTKAGSDLSSKEQTFRFDTFPESDDSTDKTEMGELEDGEA